MATITGNVTKKTCWIIWLYVVIVIILSPCRDALYLEGELTTTEKWVFVGRFCFLSDIGRLTFDVEYPQSFATQNLILYYDTEDQWPSVYPLDSAEQQTCIEKESVLRKENHQVINLTTEYVWAGCRLTKLEDNDFDRIGAIVSGGDTQKYSCQASRSFRSARERWWYVVLDNCGADKGLYMKYKLSFTNGEGFWREHFSADQFGILETNIVFLCLYFVVFLLAIYIASILNNRQLFHTTYKMYMFVLFFYMLSLIIYISYYVDYARDGVATTNTKLVAQIFQAVADGAFLLMLILMAKGYTITRGRISHSGSVKIAVIMCLYTMLYCALFIYQQVIFDEGSVLYLYESPAGFCLIALRGLCWIWFIYALFFTLKHYPEKGLFYYPFFFFYTIWFLATPVMILIATFVMPKWWREKIMNFIELLIAFTAQLVFLVLTRPSAANSNFPYHVRTSQVGFINDPTGNVNNDIDQFTHHAYGHHAMEGNGLGHAPNFTELFGASGASNKPQYQRSGSSNANNNGGLFTASAFIRGSTEPNWPAMPDLPNGHLPPLSRPTPPVGDPAYPPPYKASTDTTRDVSALFAADGDQDGHSPREVGGLFAPDNEGNGSNASSSNSLARLDKTMETTT